MCLFYEFFYRYKKKQFYNNSVQYSYATAPVFAQVLVLICTLCLFLKHVPLYKYLRRLVETRKARAKDDRKPFHHCTLHKSLLASLDKNTLERVLTCASRRMCPAWYSNPFHFYLQSYVRFKQLQLYFVCSIQLLLIVQ